MGQAAGKILTEASMRNERIAFIGLRAPTKVTIAVALKKKLDRPENITAV